MLGERGLGNRGKDARVTTGGEKWFVGTKLISNIWIGIQRESTKATRPSSPQPTEIGITHARRNYNTYAQC